MTGNATELESKNTAYALIFGSVTGLGLPLNAVSLWILLHRHNRKSPSAVFMVNLAISDLLLVASLPTRVYFYATGSWPLGSMACIWITMLFQNNIRSSSIFITFISMDRLLAVIYPLRSRHVRTVTNAVKASTLIWLIVVLINIPESVSFSRNLLNYSKPACFEFPDMKEVDRSPVVYFQPVLVLILLAVNIVSTTLVSWTVHKHLNVSAKVNNKVNVMLLFVMNLMMFIIFFLPVSLVTLYRGWESSITPLKCLASVNCCFDPLLYYFSFDGFWKKNEGMDSSRD